MGTNGDNDDVSETIMMHQLNNGFDSDNDTNDDNEGKGGASQDGWDRI